MKEKYEILKTLDVDENYVVIVAKKIKKEYKHCKDCPHLKYFGDLSLHYCAKHKGVVEPKDICIEVGM